MDGLSISGASAFQQANIAQQIQVALLKQTHDAIDQQGQAALTLLDAAAQASASVDPLRGQAIDLFV